MFSKVRMIAFALPLMLVACAEAETETDTVSDSAAAAAAPAPAAAPAAPASRDVCAMISAEELKATTTIEGSGTPSTSGGADVCTWYGSNGVNAIVQLFPSVSSYDDSREAFEDLYEKKAEDIGGLGDAAFFLAGKTGPMETATVSVRQGARAISTQILGTNSPADQRKQAIDLAKLVLGKL